MKTKKQEELIQLFLSPFEKETAECYWKIILFLSEMGYYPKKQRANIVFNHDLHNKQMAKMGVNSKSGQPFFALRFSACRGYSQRFNDIVREAVSKETFREAMCRRNECNYCSGEAADHVYTYTFPNGEQKSHCGAVALEIPGLAQRDIAEIKTLIKEEHDYLMVHEAAISQTALKEEMS